MTITSITLDPEYIYELDAGVITRKRIKTEGHSEVLAGPPGTPIDLAASDEYLFALLNDGSIHRRHTHYGRWSRINSVPLGVTSISSTQNELQMVHATGSMVSALWLPADNVHYPTDTTGLNNIKQISGDEGQRLLLLTDGTVMVQDYSGGLPRSIAAPAGCQAVEIGQYFAFFLDGAGEIWRSRDSDASGLEKLAGATGLTALGVRSDHVDNLYYSDGATVGVVDPEQWRQPPIDPGWVWGVGNSAGQIAWCANDWCDTALA